MAPRVGIEPTTKGLHIVHAFPHGVDYIFIRLRRSEALPPTFVDVLPYGIVSEPSLAMPGLGC